MYDILKAIATAKGYIFQYSRRDFSNLFEGTEQKNKPYIFLDPVEISDIDNDSGIVEQKTYSGSFMVLYSSDIDEVDYDTRYQNYIKPIVGGVMNTIKDEIRCGYSPSFGIWKTVEVINVFDYNFDGVICTYQITLDA